MLYFAYGSNLSIEQMEKRCPAAIPINSVVINNWELVFRGYADIQRKEGSKLHGGVWRITPACEKSLDTYEGVSIGLYSKKYFKFNGEPMLFYQMNSSDIIPPSKYYFSILKEGYGDFSLPSQYLFEAEQQAFAEAYDKYYPNDLDEAFRTWTGQEISNG